MLTCYIFLRTISIYILLYLGIKVDDHQPLRYVAFESVRVYVRFAPCVCVRYEFNEYHIHSLTTQHRISFDVAVGAASATSLLRVCGNIKYAIMLSIKIDGNQVRRRATGNCLHVRAERSRCVVVQ